MRISICHNRCNLIFLLLAVMIFVTQAAAAEPNTDGKLYITSDKLVAEQGNAMAEFIGNVKAIRNDAVLLADSVKVYFKSSETSNSEKNHTENGQGNVEKIVATGHVEYTAGDRKAFADKAVYTTGDETLVLTGNEPKLLTGKSWVAGKKITLFRQEERVMVESDGTKRVQAFFDSQDQQSLNKKAKGGKGDGTE